MFKVKGFKKHQQKAKSAPELIRKNASAALQQGGNKMAKHARANHDFTSRTNRAENAITATVDVGRLEMLFYINPDLVTTSSGFNYAAAQHDGTRSGWQKSIFSAPSFTSKGGQGGIQHDHFMVDASNEFKSFTIQALRAGYVRALSGVNR